MGTSVSRFIRPVENQTQIWRAKASECSVRFGFKNDQWGIRMAWNSTHTNKYAEEIAKLVDNCWFNRYTRHLYCPHDNRGEFIGTGFEEILESYGVQSQPSTVKNPQKNGAHERMHLLVCEMIWSQKLYVLKYSTAMRKNNRILQSAVLLI